MAGPENVAHQEGGHHGGVVLYLVIWLVLAVLTTATFLVSRVELSRPLHLGVALLIASVKATLVVLFFMHLYYHRGANRLVFLTAVTLVTLLIGLTVADNATRFPLANPPRGDTLKQLPPVLKQPRPYPNTEDQLPDAPRPGWQ